MLGYIIVSTVDRCNVGENSRLLTIAVNRRPLLQERHQNVSIIPKITLRK